MTNEEYGIWDMIADIIYWSFIIIKKTLEFIIDVIISIISFIFSVIIGLIIGWLFFSD